KPCNVWAYAKSGEAALLKLGPQKMKTTLALVITGPLWYLRFAPALRICLSRLRAGEYTTLSASAKGLFARVSWGAAFAATANRLQDSARAQFRVRLRIPEFLRETR